MAKRFIDTGFYKSPFVRSLQGASKALYSFIICDCTGAGIWMKDLEVASVYIGLPLNESNFAPFVDLLKAIEVAPGKFFFPDFIDHQYPTGLSEKNAAHKNFLEELLKYSVLEQCEDGNWKPLQRSSKGPIVMVKEEVMVTEKVTSVAIIEKKELAPRTPDTIRAYFAEHGQPQEADKFIDYYQSNGWKVGRNAMKDWQATARNWMRRAQPDQKDRRIVRNTTVADIQDTAKRLAKLMGETNEHDNDSCA